MSITLTAHELFEIAEQIEQNGAAFYEKAASAVPDGDNRALLLDLAAMERDHRKTFAAMREVLSAREREDLVVDPDNQIALYLQAFAEGKIFDPKADPAEFLDGERTMPEIFGKAIQLEKDSVVFYLSMKEMVPEQVGKDRIEGIIRQEMGHIAQLSNRLDSESRNAATVDR